MVRPRSVVIVLTIVLAWGLVIGGAYLVVRDISRPPEQAEPTPEENERVVYVFFPNLEAAEPGLELEARVVPEGLEDLVLAEEIMRTLIAGSKRDYDPILPPNAVLRGLYRDAEGVFYIDLDRAALRFPRDATGEMLALEAIRRSIARNLDGVVGIKILVDSEEVDTLWGHLDASRVWTGEGA